LRAVNQPNSGHLQRCDGFDMLGTFNHFCLWSSLMTLRTNFNHPVYCPRVRQHPTRGQQRLTSCDKHAQSFEKRPRPKIGLVFRCDCATWQENNWFWWTGDRGALSSNNLQSDSSHSFEKPIRNLKLFCFIATSRENRWYPLWRAKVGKRLLESH
jgi:hypothetical protein